MLSVVIIFSGMATVAVELFLKLFFLFNYLQSFWFFC